MRRRLATLLSRAVVPLYAAEYRPQMRELSAVTDVPIHLAVLILAVCFAGSFVCLVPADHPSGHSPMVVTSITRQLLRDVNGEWNRPRVDIEN